MFVFFFFFKQKTAYELRISDWSSDVCSSDLCLYIAEGFTPRGAGSPAPVSGQRPARHWLGCRAGSRHLRRHRPGRSEERRVGKGWVSTGRYRWQPDHEKKKHKYMNTMDAN